MEPARPVCSRAGVRGKSGATVLPRTVLCADGEEVEGFGPAAGGWVGLLSNRAKAPVSPFPARSPSASLDTTPALAVEAPSNHAFSSANPGDAARGA